MRVISGKYRGLVLSEFKGMEIRPTADRVKESLFNILSFQVAGARVLDLFCGSGNLGIECLSRGAGFVHFNDISRGSIAVLNKNLARLRGEKYSVTVGDWSQCLNTLRGGFDLIFIDPPYADDCGIYATQFVFEHSVLADGGTLVYERDRAFSGEIAGARVFDERKYGKTYLTFFTASDK